MFTFVVMILLDNALKYRATNGVEQHSGKISARSVVNKSKTFSIELALIN